MPTLITPHALLTQTGDPHTQIHITNLQTTLPLALDAWGRSNLPQPILISSTISLLYPFTTASSTDTVTPSTVHYGTLSKAILAATKEFTDLCTDEAPTPMHLRALVQFMHFYLTGWDTLPRFPSEEKILKRRDDLGVDAGAKEPLLKRVAMRLLELEVLLPKASLLGNGVSLKAGFGYDHEEQKEMNGPSAYSMVLRLRDLRVPTLVGINPNERLAKQMVHVNVEMQTWDWIVDGYCALEELVVKSTEESSFQTLEALAQHLVERIIQYILIPNSSFSSSPSSSFPTPSSFSSPTTKAQHTANYPRIKISLSKPTAVTFADAPTVEIVVDSNPERSQIARGVWERVGDRVKGVPFPLVGRLDEWIARVGGGE